MIVVIPFLQPFLRKHPIEDYKLIVWPMALCSIFCALFFNWSNDEWSRGVRITIFSIGSVVVIISSFIPVGACYSLGSKIVDRKYGNRMQMWINAGFDLGRAVGPPIGSYCSQNIWAMVLMIMSVAVVLGALVFKSCLAPRHD